MSPSRRRLLLLSGKPWTPIQLPDLQFWHQPSGLVGLNDTDPISIWVDSSGRGRDLTQGTAAKRPTYNIAQLNGYAGATFDGIDDQLNAPAFTYAQPEYIFMIAKIITPAVADAFWDGEASNSMLGYQSISGVVRLYAGSLGPISGAIGTDWHVISALFSGAASRLRLDGAAVLTGNPGAANGGGFKMGSNGNGASGFCNMVCVEAFGCKSLSIAQEEQAIRYAGKKYNLPVAV